MDIHKLSAVDLARKIKAREISSVEATQSLLVRLKAVHQRSNAVVTFEEDEALKAARAADEAIEKGLATGPLHGVPLAHKDMFDRTGKIASWGANIRADKPAEHDATVIARLRAAGSHEIAALHLTEFAYGPIGHNYVLGHARNPWDTGHVSGGSSSGTAMSVATGAIPAGLGSDTAGSLRLPAAACGIMSMKPTWGLVSRAGAMPLSATLDAVGPIARDARDLALMLKIIADDHGEELAGAVADQLIYSSIRTDQDTQRLSIPTRIGVRHPKLSQVIQMMEANIEEPISPSILAKDVGMSTRQLERLFRRYLNRSPKRYYMELRLQKARNLLMQTDMSVINVALACGFASPSHFSKCYRAHYNTTPYRERGAQAPRLSV